MSLTQVAQGMMTSTAQYNGFKNRITNGAMYINQRGTTATTNGGFPVDRFSIGNNSGATYTGTQDTNAPAGFSNSLKITITGTATPTGSNQFALYQGLEGYNTYDLLFGTVNAKTVTLSFWVNCSLTGTFGGALQNYAQSRSYPFSYTIASANTWQQVIVTIPGDTGGTWVGASNAGSMELCFGLSVGPTYSGPAGAWAGTTYLTVSGATNFTGTNGATFYLTGVQLESGSTATAFDYRDYGRELQMCWRYYQTYSFAANAALAIGNANTVSTANALFFFTQPFRSTPGTITLPAVGGSTGNITFTTPGGSYPSTYGTIIAQQASPTSFMFYASGFTSQWAVGNALYLYNTGGVSISASAEL